MTVELSFLSDFNISIGVKKGKGKRWLIALSGCRSACMMITDQRKGCLIVREILKGN